MQPVCENCGASLQDTQSKLCPACLEKQAQAKELVLDYDALWREAKYSGEGKTSQR